MLDHHRSGRPGLHQPPRAMASTESSHQSDRPSRYRGRRRGQPRYCLSSSPAPAGLLLDAIRGHWSIDNSLHWTLDATFREDQWRLRKDHGPQNLATLRRISHNLLKNENTLKVGIQGKRLNAGWREDYLLKVLLG